ncbi:MAG: hypothetical protein PVJ06_09850, partial [Desulfobacterales bacterium]
DNSDLAHRTSFSRLNKCQQCILTKISLPPAIHRRVRTVIVEKPQEMHLLLEKSRLFVFLR